MTTIFISLQKNKTTLNAETDSAIYNLAETQTVNRTAEGVHSFALVLTTKSEEPRDKTWKNTNN